MKTLRNIFVILMVVFSVALFAEAAKDARPDMPFNQYYVRVKKKINVRASPNTSSEIMYQIDKGEDALVIGESGEWLKIKPKDGFNPWVHKDMVQNGVIDKDNVNVRVNPSTDSSSLGKLAEGEPVIAIKTEGEWLQIELPRTYGFWIASNLAKFLCPASNYQEFLENHKLAIKAFMEAEELRKNEFTKRYFEVDHDALIKAYQEIIDQYPDTPEALKAQERIIDTREKKAMAQQRTLTMDELRKSLKLFEEAENVYQQFSTQSKITSVEYQDLHDKYKDIADHYGSSKEGKESLKRLQELESIKASKVVEAEAPKEYVEIGKLKVNKEENSYKEATHILVKPGFGKNIICAVYCKNTDLRAFEKKSVQVQGRTVTPASDSIGYPLVEVEKISLNK